MAKDEDDDELLPRATSSKTSTSSGAGKLVPDGKKPSRPMLRLIRLARAIGVLVGGFVTVVGLMSLVGVVTDVFWARLAIALVVGIALPAFVADRVLKRVGGGGVATVVDVFAIVLLAVALLFVGLDTLTRGMLRSEGDRHARSGDRLMARAVYFLAGVSPRFPGDEGWRGEGSPRPATATRDAGAPDGGPR